MRLLLHPAKRTRGSDWDQLSPAKRTAWQRVAASSYGVLTPGNLITLVGGVLVINGLFMISRGSVIDGLVVIVLGRMADVLDGLVAEYTKTKSDIGELLDATIDKIVIFTALIVILTQDLVPQLVALVVLAQSIYNSLLALLAKVTDHELHSSAAGKWTTALAWLVLLSYMLAGQLKNHAWHIGLLWFAGLCFCLFVLTGLVSGYQYSRQLYQEFRRDEMVNDKK
jgi:phosphatidylglycerophosphate synthase